MVLLRTYVCPHVIIPYPLRKLTLTSSFSYWWIRQISVFTSCQVLSADYVRVSFVYLFSFFVRLHKVETFFVPFSFVSTLYTILSPSVSTLYSILYPHFSMLESISSLFDPNLITFTTLSLVEGGLVWREYTFSHPIIISQNVANRAICRASVKNLRSYVLCYSMQ